jgi:hypothetical protein
VARRLQQRRTGYDSSCAIQIAHPGSMEWKWRLPITAILMRSPRAFVKAIAFSCGHCGSAAIRALICIGRLSMRRRRRMWLTSSICLEQVLCTDIPQSYGVHRSPPECSDVRWCGCHLGCNDHRSWRGRMGIEPTQDASTAPATVLKTAGVTPASLPSTSRQARLVASTFHWETSWSVDTIGLAVMLAVGSLADDLQARGSLTADQRTWSGRHAADFELKVQM